MLYYRVEYSLIIPPKLEYKKTTAMSRRRSHTSIYMKTTERHSENVFFAKRQDAFYGTEKVFISGYQQLMTSVEGK
jgi:hypothetical protein